MVSDSGAIWEEIQMTATTPIGWFALAAGWSQRQGRANRTMQYLVLLQYYLRSLVNILGDYCIAGKIIALVDMTVNGTGTCI